MAEHDAVSIADQKGYGDLVEASRLLIHYDEISRKAALLADIVWNDLLCSVSKAVLSAAAKRPAERSLGVASIGPLGDGSFFDIAKEVSDRRVALEKEAAARNRELESLNEQCAHYRSVAKERETRIESDRENLKNIRDEADNRMRLLFPSFSSIDELGDLVRAYYRKNNKHPEPGTFPEVLDAILQHRDLFSEPPSALGSLLEREANRVREYISAMSPDGRHATMDEIARLRDGIDRDRDLRARIDRDERYMGRMLDKVLEAEKRICSLNEMETPRSLPEIMNRVVNEFVVSQHDKDRMVGLKIALGNDFPEGGDRLLNGFQMLRDASERMAQPYRNFCAEISNDDFRVGGSPDTGASELRYVLEDVRKELVALGADLGIDFKLPTIELKPKRKEEGEHDKIAGMAI